MTMANAYVGTVLLTWEKLIKLQKLEESLAIVVNCRMRVISTLPNFWE